MQYGLYVAHSKEPEYTGTAGECRAQVDLLSDEQKESGWTIGPIPAEAPELPIDPNLWKRVVVIACVFGVIILILGLALWAGRGR
jgi:hypothetical protein